MKFVAPEVSRVPATNPRTSPFRMIPLGSNSLSAVLTMSSVAALTTGRVVKIENGFDPPRPFLVTGRHIATVLLNHAARARYDELRREAKNGRLRSPGSAPPSRNAAAPTRGSRIHRVRRRAVVTNGPGPLVVDEFVRRLVGAAVAATLLIACASERARSSGASRPRRRVDTAIVYAADYPPCPVRYAAVTRDSAAER